MFYLIFGGKDHKKMERNTLNLKKAIYKGKQVFLKIKPFYLQD